MSFPKLRFLRLRRTSSVALAPLLLGLGTACSSQGNVPTSGAPARQAVAALAASPVALLEGSLHPAARPERDLGRMDPTITLQNLSLVFTRSALQKKQLAHDLVAIGDPASPAYHRWLTPAEFGARYGAAPKDVARTRAWLVAQGFVVDAVPDTASRITFHGSVGQLERAFRTEMHHYQVRGESHFALSRAPAVPVDLGTVVASLHGAHDLRTPPPKHPLSTFDGALALGPSDFATIYDTAPLYAAGITGAGQTIAIVGESAYNHADILAFRQTFGLDTSNLPTDVLVPNTGQSGVFDPGDVSETTLDLEWSGAVAKDAQLLFVYTGDSSNYGFFDSMVYAVEQRVAPIVSVSYGTCEQGLAPSDAVYYGQVGDLAAMEGVTVLVASGDTGAAGCDGQQETAATQGLFVGFPASIPTIFSIGGSQFNFTGANEGTYWSSANAALTYIPEVAWNQTFGAHTDGLGAGGGGYSIVFPRPYWQAGALPGSTFRGIPDVSLTASSADVPYIISESWTSDDGPGQAPFAEELMAIGGTSASTPSFAGIVALLNQSIHAAVPGVGNVGPVLYALYKSAPTAFHDITGGSNMVPCVAATLDCNAGMAEYGYNAGPGYDLATGLGSVDAYNLVTAWTSLAPTSTTLSVQSPGATDSGLPEGSALSLTATVGSNTTAHALTGNVTFYFNTFDTSNNPDLAHVLGEAPITADVADGGTSGATATLTAPAPVGLTGASQIVAFYGGDQHFLGSYSAAAKVMTTSTLTITPPSATVQPRQVTMFTASGGVPPVSWRIASDGTCSFDGNNCSESKVLSPTTVAFQGGLIPGTVTLEALDSDFAEVRVTITVAGSPVDAGPLIPVDAGHDAGHDAGDTFDAGDEDAGVDATGSDDAGSMGTGMDSGGTKKVDSGSSAQETMSGEDSGAVATDASKPDGGKAASSGGCTVAAHDAPDVGVLGGILFALIPLASRRRRTS